MNRAFATLVAVVGLASAAHAQQAPVLVGNYSANVLEEYGAQAVAAQESVATHSVVHQPTDANPAADQNYSGK